MKNPDKYIRAAYISALTSASGLPVFDGSISISVNNLPDKYFLIGTQTKNPTATSKNGWEWSCTVEIQCISVQDKGFRSSAAVDDMEEYVLSAGRSLSVPVFNLISTTYIDSIRSDIESQTNTIGRKIVAYRHWLNMEE